MPEQSVPLFLPQQLAAIGRLTGAAPDLDTLLRFTLDCIGGRDVTGCAVLQLAADGVSLRLRAGSGSLITVSADPTSPAGEAIAAGSAVLYDDLRGEQFADQSALANGGTAAVLAPITGSAAPFGLLAVYGATQSAFSSADIGILQAVAALIGSAVDRFERDERGMLLEQQHRLLLERTAEAVLLLDAAGRILAANPAASQIFRFAPEELLTLTLDDLLPAEDAAAQLAAFFSATPATTLRRTALARRNFFLAVEVVAAPLATDRLQVIIRHVPQAADRGAEDGQSEELFFQVFHSSAAATAITHFSGVYIDVNEACLQMMGATRDEVIGHNSQELNFWADPEQRQKIGRLLAEHGQVSNVEIKGHHRNGEIRDLLASLVLITLDGDMCVVTSFMDMTEQKRAAEIRRAHEAAEQASRAKSEFLSRMSHELRTPLNAILGFAQLMELGDQSRANRESIGHILVAGRHLLQLINEVLDISSIEQGHSKLQSAPLQLEELIDQVLREAAPLAQQVGLTLHKVIRTHGTSLVRADRKRLAQVLLHLTTNAIHYNRPGGTVTLSCVTVENGCLRVTVADTGRGIAPQKLLQLFMPFERLGAEQTSVEGTGLGLLLSQRLMEAMGSKIELSSVLGIGSEFWFDLPAAETAADVLTLPEARIVEQPAAQQTTILYLEDVSDPLNLVGRIVARWPEVTLVRARSDNQALGLLHSLSPTLVLLDTDLPVMDSAALIQRLKVGPTSQEIPVVVISSARRDSELNALLNAGANAYLSKPLNVAEFMRVVGSLVGYSPR